MQIAPASIESLAAKHIAEYFRLLDVPTSEQDRKSKEFIESRPYAPHLLRLLEEQVLIATDAQETRDMIRILANLAPHLQEIVGALWLRSIAVGNSAGAEPARVRQMTMAATRLN